MRNDEIIVKIIPKEDGTFDIATGIDPEMNANFAIQALQGAAQQLIMQIAGKTNNYKVRDVTEKSKLILPKKTLEFPC